VEINYLWSKMGYPGIHLKPLEERIKLQEDKPTPCSRVLLQKLVVTQLIKKFPAFYVTRRFITVFTTGRHQSLFWVICIQSTPCHTISQRFILIFSSHLRLRLPSGLVPSGFPTKILHAFLTSPKRATCSTHLFREARKLCSSSISSSLTWSTKSLRSIEVNLNTFEFPRNPESKVCSRFFRIRSDVVWRQRSPLPTKHIGRYWLWPA